MAHVETTDSGTVKSTVQRGAGKALEDVRITPSANGGYSVSVSYRDTKRTRKGGVMSAPIGWYQPETLVFNDFNSLVAGLRKCFGAK